MPDIPSALADVRTILADEHEAIRRHVLSWDVDPCVMLMDVIRFIDNHVLKRHFQGDTATAEEAQDDMLLRLGLNPVLLTLLPRIDDDPGFPLTPSTNDSLSITGSLLHSLGRIRFVERCIELVRSGAFSVERSSTKLVFRRSELPGGLEVHEQLDEIWLDRAANDPPLSVPPEIRSEMRALVYRWRDHFIGYDSTPAMDSHFMFLAMSIHDRQRDRHGIQAKHRFGSFSGGEILTSSAMLASLYAKHLIFCSEYMEKYPDAFMPNILTIWVERDELTRSISDFASLIHRSHPPSTDVKFRLTRQNTYRCLSALSLSKRNVVHHCNRFHTPLPALISVRRNFWIKPLASLVEGPLGFGARELRRLHPREWDKNIRAREAWFRTDLYALFAGTRYLCLERERQLSLRNRTITDIDAAIIDVVTKRLALFQLKWQEPIGMEEAERRSRAVRLRTDVLKWVGAIKELGHDDLLAQMGLTADLSGSLAGIHFFVLTRHHARFSGFPIDHPECAIASWRQFQRARLEMGTRDDTFVDLFGRLKSDETRPPPHHTAFAKFSVAGLEVEAEQFFVSETEVDEAGPSGTWLQNSDGQIDPVQSAY